MKTGKNSSPIRTALLYAFFSALWILLSDEILNFLLPHTSPLHIVLATVKGWLFVCVTASLLYLILRSDMKSLQERQKHINHQAGLIADVSDAIISTDMQFRILSWNTAAEHMYGWKASEVIGRGMREFVQSEYFNISREEIIKTAMEQGKWKGEVSQNHKNGSRFFVSTSLSLVKDQDGRHIGFVAINRDITERKHLDEVLRASELRFRSLIENGLDNISLLAANGTLLWESPATVRTLGYEPDQFKGSNILELVHPDDIEWVQSQFEGILSKPSFVSHGSFRIKHSNGTWRWVESTGTNLLHEPSVNAVVINYHDITERKEAEEALNLSQEQMRSMIHEAPISIAMFDLDMKYITASHRWIREYGNGDPDLMGKSHYDVLPDIPARWREMHQRGLAGETLNNDDDLWIHEDGRKEWLCWSVVPWHDVHGKISGIILSIEDTTQRKRAEDALKASEEKYRDLVENGQDLICTHDLEGNLLSVNEAAVKLTGYSREFLLQMNLKDALAPHGEKQFAAYLEEIKVQGQAHGSMKVRTANGEFRIWEYNNTLRTEGLANSIVRGAAHDITERKQAEQALRESEERLRLSLQAANQGLYDLNVQTGAAIVNREYAQMLGYNPETFVETNNAWIERLHPDDRDVTAKVYSDYIQGITPEYRVEFRQKTKDGNWIWILSLGKVVEYDTDGKPLRMLGTHTDITMHKQAEKRLRESESNLKRSQQIAHVGHWVWDIRQNTVIWSDEMKRIFGLDPENFQGDLNEVIMKTIHPNDRERVFKLNEVAIHEGDPISTEYRVVWSNGDVRHIWAEPGDSIHDEQGSIIQLSGIVQDITERKRAEELIRQYTDELELRVEERTAELVLANRAKDEFLASMSHELRTPLNGILGFSETLLEGIRGPMNDKQGQAVQMIRSSGEHLLGLINDILDVSKIEAGKFEIRPENIAVNEICQSSLIFIKDFAGKKSITVEYSLSPSTPIIFADPKRLKQILVNLLNNAVKFTPEKGVVKLEVQADATAGLMRFSITDTGIGIDPKDLQNLFKPFFQVDSSLSRKYEGSGLGLTLVKKLVEMHGGSVNVESEAGKGSCFSFIIPTQSLNTPIIENTTLSAHHNPDETTTKYKREKRHILLVEDNITNMMVTRDYLNHKGFQVIEAKDGNEAIKYAQEQKPDLILMDIQMPGMSGLEAIKRLRATPEFASVPIIALTALAMPSDRELCLEAGASAYLAKPVSFKKLIELISEILN